MNRYVALLRAVNVGGSGKLPMAALKAMCEEAHFANVRTYLASGNVLFSSVLGEAKIKAMIEEKLLAYFGKAVRVLVRSGDEMAAVFAKNPYRNAVPNQVVALFLDSTPASDAHTNISGRKSEQLSLGVREIYIHYGEGQAASRLVIPAAHFGTARNMNTIEKIATMLAEMPQ
jgi:uncharacterized protein (DUF1697 family)